MIGLAKAIDGCGSGAAILSHEKNSSLNPLTPSPSLERYPILIHS